MCLSNYEARDIDLIIERCWKAVQNSGFSAGRAPGSGRPESVE